MTPIVDPYCRVCKTALDVFTQGASGKATFVHARPPAEEHDPDPVPLAELGDAVMRCDFCSSTGVRWVYAADNQTRTPRVVTSQTVGLGDYRDRHRAARARSVETKAGVTSNLGEGWAACEPCADLIEGRDLLGLMRRAVDALPRKATSAPRRLVEVRANMRAVYEPLLATIGPRTEVPSWRPPASAP